MTTTAQATELTNKIRWAIGSTLDGANSGAFSLLYREQMWLASELTDRVFGVLAALRERGTSNGTGQSAISRKLLQNLLTQELLSD